MSDDDLDLELELDDGPDTREKRPAAQAEAKPAPEASKPAAAASKPAASAAAAGQRKGLLRGISSSAAAVKGLSWNARTFLLGLAVLLIVVVFAENWAPVRVYAFGLALEMPKAVCFVLDVLLGAVLMWLLLRRSGRAGEAPK